MSGSVIEGSGPAGSGQPRGKRRFSAAVALAVWASVLLLGLLDAGPAGVVWLASGVLTCLAGLGVAIGRARTGRGDTWQAALVTAPASLLGPLSAALLLVPRVRRSLREVPLQLLARGEELETLGHTPEQAVVAHRQGASLALGLAASTLAFWSGILVGIWLGLAGGTLTDGGWFALGLLVALVVGMLGFVGALVVMRRRRVLALLEQTAAACMVVAIVFVALDGGDLHWDDGTRVSISLLYWVWALVAILFLWGSAMTRRRPNN
jgi:F0F1-type ATP synthase assembly protein I